MLEKLAVRYVLIRILVFPLSTRFHHWSTVIFIYMLLLLEGHMGEASETSSKGIACFGNHEKWDEKYCIFLFFVMLVTKPYSVKIQAKNFHAYTGCLSKYLVSFILNNNTSIRPISIWCLLSIVVKLLLRNQKTHRKIRELILFVQYISFV